MFISPENPPDLAAFAALATRAYAEIPPGLARHADALMIRVLDLPPPEVCADLELDSPYDLLGLYEGVNLAEKSLFEMVDSPDQVYLYRLPMLREWEEVGGDFYCLVREVLFHEIGHHFGLSDAAMERICAQVGRD